MDDMDKRMGGFPELAYECDWVPVIERQGDWLGHVFPGLIFIIWGTHWLTGTYMRYFEAKRAQRPFLVQSTECVFPFVRPCRRAGQRVPIESIAKAVGAFLLFWLQLYYGAYKWISCPSDSPRAGHIATQHLNAWAHATMNLGFSLSGIVELVSLLHELPEGVTQGFLSLAFFLEYLLMGLHEKHGMLDSMLHRLIAYTMLAGSVFAGLECVWNKCMPLSAARALAMVLQGTWFCQAGSVLFGGHRFWQDIAKDPKGTMISEMGPGMALPVFFCFHILAVTFYGLLVYLAAGLCMEGRRGVGDGLGGLPGHGHGSDPAYAHERTGLLSHDSDGGTGLMHGRPAPQKAVAMQPLSEGARGAF